MNLAGLPLEKAALAGQALAVEGGQSGTPMTQVLFYELEQSLGGRAQVYKV